MKELVLNSLVLVTGISAAECRVYKVLVLVLVLVPYNCICRTSTKPDTQTLDGAADWSSALVTRLPSTRAP
jgi:uncharacterized membrane protein